MQKQIVKVRDLLGIVNLEDNTFCFHFTFLIRESVASNLHSLVIITICRTISGQSSVLSSFVTSGLALKCFPVSVSFLETIR